MSYNRRRLDERNVSIEDLFMAGCALVFLGFSAHYIAGCHNNNQNQPQYQQQERQSVVTTNRHGYYYPRRQ